MRITCDTQAMGKNKVIGIKHTSEKFNFPNIHKKHKNAGNQMATRLSILFSCSILAMEGAAVAAVNEYVYSHAFWDAHNACDNDGAC